MGLLTGFLLHIVLPIQYPQSMDPLPDLLPSVTPLDRLAPNGRPWSDLIPDDRVRDPVQVIFEHEASLAIPKILRARLSLREYIVLQCKFGLNVLQGNPRSRAFLASRWAISKERIRQIEESALHKLRSHPRSLRALKALM